MINLGIFSTASTADLDRMSSYAGRHKLCRQTVSVTVVELGSYSFDKFPDTIDGAVQWFEAARKKTPPEFRDALKVRLEFEESYYDSGASASLQIWYERLETDEEMKARFDDYLQYIRNSAAQERAHYESLKRKFEP